MAGEPHSLLLVLLPEDKEPQGLAPALPWPHPCSSARASRSLQVRASNTLKISALYLEKMPAHWKNPAGSSGAAQVMVRLDLNCIHLASELE